MNCQPGDIAIVVSSGAYKGHLFEILYAAPNTAHVLPDGRPHSAPKVHPSWVLKSLSGGARAPLSDGTWRIVLYGVGRDSALRPLRGDPNLVDVDERNEIEEPA